MYYRRAAQDEGAMSRKGYAMFADSEDAVSNYGECLYEYDGAGAVDLNDSTNDIREAIDSDPELPFCGNLINAVDYCADMEITIGEFIESFNPTDIVNHAGIFDNEDMVLWLWDNVFERKGIRAVLTHNGAVVFDENLIRKA